MQSRQWVKLAMLAIVGLIGVNNIGYAQDVDAGQYVGGGFIDSAAGAPDKATFGFNLEGVDENHDALVDRVDVIQGGFLYYWLVGQGQFQYNDHGAGVKFHLDHDASYELDPDGSEPDHVSVRTRVIIPPFPPIIEVLGMDWVGTYSSAEGTGTVVVSVNAE